MMLNSIGKFFHFTNSHYICGEFQIGVP